MKLEINHNTFYNYVEFSFWLPINDLFYKKWDDDIPKPDGKEIAEVCHILEIPFDQKQIEKDYWNESNNIEVYHSLENKEVFILFDLLRDLHDQCDMIFIGIRCSKNNDDKIRDLLLGLYKKRNPRSNFQIDYFNQSLYLKVFNSDFYFYKNEKNQNRKINHCNLI